jgi:hypothetical protein
MGRGIEIKPGLDSKPQQAMPSCMDSVAESETGVPLNCGMDSPFDVTDHWDRARASLNRAAVFIADKAESLGIDLPFDLKYNCGTVNTQVVGDTPRLVIEDDSIIGDGADEMPISAREYEEEIYSGEGSFDNKAGIDDHIQQLRRDYPALVQHSVVCTKKGVYQIAGRAVEVYFDYDEDEDIILMVRDGPLTQPFLDYVFDTGENEDFEVVTSSTNLQTLPEHARLQVPDSAPSDCRLTSMRTAKTQAAQREAHAKLMVKSGQYFHSPSK